jgi:Shikimate kinase
MKHIILIGFMGSGKTRVGRRLARHLELPFIDMDEQIVERAKMPVTEIFEKYGEAHFRELETKVLEELLDIKEQMVISAGGGVAVQKVNQEYLKETIVVYLQATVETLVKRLSGDATRPILNGGNLKEKIMALKEERDPIYEQVSNIAINTSNMGVLEIVTRLSKEIAKYEEGT